MIYKSYLVEQNIGILKNKLTLIYGENLGLQNDLKKKIIEFYKKSKILKFEQDDILKSNQIYYTELNNKSLFEEKKIILINNCNDKILEIVQDSIDVIEDNKVFIFSNILEKKSKIRNYFEKQKYLDIVPCYKDNEIDIKRTISNELRNFKGFNQEIVNLISENTINDRIKLTNEIEKIKNYFNNISLNINDLNIALFKSLLLIERISFGFAFISLFSHSGKYLSFWNELKYRSSRFIIFILFSILFRFAALIFY